MKTPCPPRSALLLAALLTFGPAAFASESPYLYGIFAGGDPNPVNPSEYMGHITGGGASGWVTVTVAVGANTNDSWGIDYRSLTNGGHTVICRINHGYFPNGTIPLTNKYNDFATRCSNFVAHSQGCSIWTIGNELNISGEWPYDATLGKAPYVTPSNYALCFRKVSNAIKAVRPGDKVLPEAPACFSGPFSAGSNPYTGTNYPYEANPLTWVQHLNAVLTAITNTGPNAGPPDGIALHVSSRGYTCADIQSTAVFGGAAAGLYNSFFVYKDWVNKGIPPGLYNLPLYATECNGYYFWNGGHPENVFAHYEAGWMQAVYEEVNRYNQSAFATGKPVFRCFNMYQWPAGFDGWFIDGSSFKGQILSDLDEAAAKKYTWPASLTSLLAPVGFNFVDPAGGDDTVAVCDFAGVEPIRSWNNLTAGAGPSTFNADGGISIVWGSPGGGSHTLPIGNAPGDYNLMQGYLDNSDTSTATGRVSGLKFPLYDVIVYCDGDNGGATRVGKYTISNNIVGALNKYVRDDGGVNFSGSYTEADSTTGGAGAPSGNYCRFHNVRGSNFSFFAKGDYASDAHPRSALAAIEIVPVNVVPWLTEPAYTGGQFQFTLNGAANANYVIQASTNLSSWTAIRTNPAPALITDPASGGLRKRFYRALFQ